MSREALNWRYATKKFDPNKKVPEEDMHELLEVLRLSPSSFGIQPWKFVVVTDKHIREKLKESAWGQPQITDASHLIVLCARTDVDENFIKRYVESISGTRNVPVEALKGYQDMMVGFRNRMPEEKVVDWAKNQVYLSLGMLLYACATKKIDACPMEGFDPAGFDKILELDKHNATATVICAVGYRSNEDETAHDKKVRFGKDDIFLHK